MITTRTTRPMRLATAAATATLAASGLALSALGGAGAASADGPDAHRTESGQQGPGTPAARSTPALVGATSCNGGRPVSLQSRYVGTPFTFGYAAGAPQDVPGTAQVLRGPRHGHDTYLITYSAETLLSGSGSGWMGLEAYVDSHSIAADTNGSPLALTGESTFNSNSTQFCVRLGPGRHRLQMSTNIVDSGATGWLDDYTTSVQRFD